MKHIGAAILALMLCVSLTACGEDEAAVNLRVAAMSSVGLVNYLGNAENIHPKVLYFEDGWNGHRYWMAYTPYPKGAVDAENPCIAVSDDGVRWEAPEGVVNPLAPQPAGGYNSDTHLVYNPADGSLECWWRAYDIPSRRDRILRRISRDGVGWSAPETVLPASDGREWQCLSPAVSIIDGRYVMLYSDGAHIYIMRSSAEAPVVSWEAPVRVDIPFIGKNHWHQDMVVSADGREAVVISCCYGPDGNNNSADLYGMVFDLERARSTVPVLLIARGELNPSITGRSLYRSSLVRVGSRYRIYYSSIDEGWHRHLDMTEGDWNELVSRLRGASEAAE